MVVVLIVVVVAATVVAELLMLSCWAYYACQDECGVQFRCIACALPDSCTIAVIVNCCCWCRDQQKDQNKQEN